MKALFLPLAALVLSGTAHAGQLVCTGSYIGHNFNVRATTSGAAISGPIHLKVTGPFHNEEGDLPTKSSSIQPGRQVSFSGASDRATANLNANFRSGTTYVGTMSVSGDGGGGNINMTCTLSGRPFDNEPGDESDYEI